jgi:AcrR family transcriptional regulator
MASLPDHLMPTAVGRDRLPKAVVAEHQRDRVLGAATGVFAGRGYHSTTVDHIVVAARVGVGTFYSLFSSKEDCFLCLYDRIAAESRERLVASAPPDAPWADRVLAGLGATLELVAAEPDRARIVIVEAPTAGAAAERRHAETIAELTAILREGRAVGPRGEAPPASFEDAAVAGLAWILHQRLAERRPVAAEELLAEMAGFVVEPYLGGRS